MRVAVVGAGPAGLALSSRLARTACRHVVLERGRVGWSWRTQRWDSFRLNTPLWANLVPGEPLSGSRDTFLTAASLVAGLESLATGLPVVENAEVLRARLNGDLWRLETSQGLVLASSVVVASGFQNVPRTPDYADALPTEVEQLHAADYRRPDDLDGPVLVVGGGQSGLQIAEDVLGAGHRAYLASSRVGRLPRRHRGRDAFDWMRDTGQLDLPRERADPAVIAATPPQISGAGGGRTLSYQDLAKRGATLLGHAVGCDGRARAGARAGREPPVRGRGLAGDSRRLGQVGRGGGLRRRTARHRPRGRAGSGSLQAARSRVARPRVRRHLDRDLGDRLRRQPRLATRRSTRHGSPTAAAGAARRRRAMAHPSLLREPVRDGSRRRTPRRRLRG